MNLPGIQAAVASLRNMLARQPRVLGFSIDGGGATIAAGTKSYLPVPFSGRIQGWCLIADQVGSIVVDVWKVPFAGAPPTVANSICGGAKPTLASAQKAESYGALSGWAVDVQAGDVVGFNVDSSATIQRATLTLRVQLA